MADTSPRRLRRGAVVALTSALALGASAGAASGASFDVRTVSFETSGLARTWGSVTSPTETTMRIAARVDDVCATSGAEDGYKAHVTFQVRFVDGTRSSITVRDERRCAAAPRPIREYRTFDRRIRSIYVYLFEARRQGSGFDVADGRGKRLLLRVPPRQ